MHSIRLMWSTAFDPGLKVKISGAIWRRRFQSETAFHGFCPRNTGESEIVHFRFVVGEKSDRKITWSSWLHRFRKAPFSNCCPSTLKRIAGVFKLPRLKDRFPNVPFSCRISVDRRLNRRNKAAFSKFSRVVLTGLNVTLTKKHFKGNWTSHYVWMKSIL